jgi:hypothetical protein
MLVVQYSRMDHPAPIKGNAAVMWNKWRLLDDRELYDVKLDPAQERNAAAHHPQVVEKMREHYERWWADVQPRVNELSDITIGSPAEPVTLLSPADWQDVFLDQQKQVRDGMERNGWWGLDVSRDGEYAFELRRWPREADLPLDAAAPAWKGADGEFPPGRALAIAEATLRVGDHTETQSVRAGDRFVQFTVRVKAGTTRAQTWFRDRSGGDLCGAYYVYVERVP